MIVGGGLHDDNMGPRRYVPSEPTWRKEAREIVFVILLGLFALAAARVMPLVVVLLASHAVVFAVGGYMGFKARDNEKFSSLRRPRG